MDKEKQFLAIRFMQWSIFNDFLFALYIFWIGSNRTKQMLRQSNIERFCTISLTKTWTVRTHECSIFYQTGFLRGTCSINNKQNATPHPILWKISYYFLKVHSLMNTLRTVQHIYLDEFDVCDCRHCTVPNTSSDRIWPHVEYIITLRYREVYIEI